MQKITFGHSIEALVCAFLEDNHLICIQKNFACRLGEIDLVMLEPASNALVFVEVRFRTEQRHGSATESVDWRKQRKLRRTVQRYLQIHADAHQPARIDVIGVSYGSHSSNAEQICAPGVSVHRIKQHELVWTRNAIEEG